MDGSSPMTKPNIPPDDLALLERDADSYVVLLAEGSVDFHALKLADPVPLGRQILTAAKLRDLDSYTLFAILPSGDFEDIRLDEPFDLRGKGVERLIVFQSDRVFRFKLNESQIAWGQPTISENVLRGLAGIGADEGVYLEVRGGEDRLLETGTVESLEGPGVERFITAPVQLTYEITVNSRARDIDHAVVTYEEIVQLAFPGQHDPNVSFSMTYRKADSVPHAGELGAGGTVTVKKKGTIFNVTRTVQS